MKYIMMKKIKSAVIAPAPTLLPCNQDLTDSLAIIAFTGPGGAAIDKPKLTPNNKYIKGFILTPYLSYL